MNRLLLRVDANSEIGWGHLMRCLALADAWRDLGGRTTFVIQRSAASNAALARVRTRGHRCFELLSAAASSDDLRFLRCIARAVAADWVVLDGYHFSTEFQRGIRNAGLGLAVFDDTGHLPAYDCDLLINSSVLASQIPYICDSSTRKLFGPRYVPLRTEVRCCQMPRPNGATGHHVLVTLGGGDSRELALKVLAALRAVTIEPLEVQFVVGPSATTAAALAEEFSRMPDSRVEIVTATEDLPARMAWADVAISAAGGTLWELAYLGVPALSLTRADNQQPISTALAACGAALALGDAQRVLAETITGKLQMLLSDSAARRAMSEAGRQLIDGHGAARIAREMGQAQLELRAAADEDREVIWHWANEPAARAQSFNQQSIAWSAHCDWFAAQLTDANCLLLVALSSLGEPIGQVRFQRQQNYAVTSVSVAQRYRGQGLGPRLIRRAAGQAFDRWPGVVRLEAEVKLLNLASQRAFELAGFRAHGSRECGGAAALIFRREREGNT